MPDELNSQEFLFQRIRELLPVQFSLVDSVAEILHLSSDSAYRRIRGETPLVMDEVQRLCAHFRLSMDQLFQINSHSILFEQSRLDRKNNDYEKYLKGLLERMRFVNSFMNREMIYVSKDLPVFHNFYYRPVFAFRYYFWMRTLIQHPDFVNRKFSMDCLPPSIEAVSHELRNEYCQMPSAEILNTECINAMISQVEFCRDSGCFSSNKEVREIYEGIRDTILHLKEQVDYGSKFLPDEKSPGLKKKNFRFYYNRVLLGDNTILITTDHTRTIFLNYDALNYLMSRDENFCEACYEDMQQLMRKGTIISTTSEKQRNIFFGILSGKINERLLSL